MFYFCVVSWTMSSVGVLINELSFHSTPLMKMWRQKEKNETLALLCLLQFTKGFDTRKPLHCNVYVFTVECSHIFYSELNLLFGWRSQFCSSVISHPWCTDPSQLVSFPFSLEVEWWIQDQQVMSQVHACYASMAMSVTTNNGSVECLHTWKLKI